MTNTRVSLFASEGLAALESAINDELRERKDVIVKDIKLVSDDRRWTAMVIYEITPEPKEAPTLDVFSDMKLDDGRTMYNSMMERYEAIEKNHF